MQQPFQVVCVARTCRVCLALRALSRDCTLSNRRAPRWARTHQGAARLCSGSRPRSTDSSAARRTSPCPAASRGVWAKALSSDRGRSRRAAARLLRPRQWRTARTPRHQRCAFGMDLDRAHFPALFVGAAHVQVADWRAHRGSALGGLLCNPLATSVARRAWCISMSARLRASRSSLCTTQKFTRAAAMDASMSWRPSRSAERADSPASMNSRALGLLSRGHPQVRHRQQQRRVRPNVRGHRGGSGDAHDVLRSVQDTQSSRRSGDSARPGGGRPSGSGSTFS